LEGVEQEVQVMVWNVPDVAIAGPKTATPTAAPAVECLLGRADLAGSLSHCAALGYRHLSLSELFDYLLRRMSPPSHISPFLRPNSNILPGPVFGGQVNIFDRT